MYRGLMMWAAAVKQAKSLDKDKVRTALAQTKLEKGPGGPAEMVKGENHVRMNMYIAVAKSGKYEIVEQLGAIEPKECARGLK
jgi:branched-chain amino acid transport system substrate-binding protein